MNIMYDALGMGKSRIPMAVSQYVPKTIIEREERPDGTLVIRKIYFHTINHEMVDEYIFPLIEPGKTIITQLPEGAGSDEYIDEMVIFANDGKILSSNDGQTIKLNYVHTEYDMDLNPLKVQMKKTISRINHNDVEDFYHFEVYYEDDGSIYTEDTYLLPGGNLMTRKYVPASDDEPIQFVDGVFIGAELVEEIQI